MLFGLRFDFRNPEFAGTAMADRYQAALEMAEWADHLGAVTITVSEHHGSPDGYLPSPVPVVAAMAARTTNVRLSIAALIAPFYDPLRLAEDLVVLDNLSRGRVDLVVAAGYVQREFAMYGIEPKDRVARLTEVVATLRGAFSGKPFDYRGHTVQVTPAPYTEGGPSIILGGSSEPAARRAARLGDGFVPSDPKAWEFYRDEMQRLGRQDPGPRPTGGVQVVALAADAEEGWGQMGPYFLHEMNAYGGWLAESHLEGPYRLVADTDALRVTGQYRVLTPARFIEEQRAAPFPFALFQPLCGGMPIELAWSSLRLFEDEVLPAFRP